MYKISIYFISGSGEQIANRRFQDDQMLRGENVGHNERLVAYLLCIVINVKSIRVKLGTHI